MTQKLSQEGPGLLPGTLLLDAECGLCTRSALFLKPRLSDPESLRFVGQQSEEGADLMGALPESLQDLDTVVLYEGSEVYVRSDAVLRCGLHLRWSVRWIFVLGFAVPRPLRDSLYRWVARNRSRWWPPPDTCAF